MKLELSAPERDLSRSLGDLVELLDHGRRSEGSDASSRSDSLSRSWWMLETGYPAVKNPWLFMEKMTSSTHALMAMATSDFCGDFYGMRNIHIIMGLYIYKVLITDKWP